MAKKKASGDLAVGVRVRVRPGTPIPEFPDLECSGWTGMIVDLSGKKPPSKFVIEWDDATLAGMPESYVAACESQGLYYRMVCLDGTAIEAAD